MVRGSGAVQPARKNGACRVAFFLEGPTGKLGGAAEICVPSFCGWQRLRRAQLQAKVSTTQRARTLRPAAPAACCHRSRTCRSHWRHFAPAMAMIYMTSCSCGPLTADTLHANLAGLRTLRADRASRVHSGHVTREDSGEQRNSVDQQYRLARCVAKRTCTFEPNQPSRLNGIIF